VLRVLFSQAGLAGNIGHVPLSIHPQHPAHILVRIVAFVMGLGLKTAAVLGQETIQMLSQLLDFIKRCAPPGDLCYRVDRRVIRLYMPQVCLFGEVT
jgi:hypothetical protein